MASTIAMYTGLSGLNANARNLDVIGNNIANVNTTGYKSNRLLFQNQFSRTFGLGTAPGGSTGGTNPMQIGLGVRVGATQRNFNPGSLTTTGNPSDLAIAGTGFFMVDRGLSRFYTRAGAFTLNPNQEMVNGSGDRLVGWGVDSNFQVQRTTLAPITVPLGQMRIAEATRNASLTGTLRGDDNATIATAGARLTMGPLTDTSGPIATTSLLTDLRNASAQPIAAAGDVITISGVHKGGSSEGAFDIPDASLTVTATTTLQDYMDFMSQTLQIQPGAANPDGFTPGVTLNTATGVIDVVGNTGNLNDLSFDDGQIKVFPGGTGTAVTPFQVSKTAPANGESARTNFIVYDSLGNEVNVSVTMTLISRGGATPGTTWRYDIASADDNDGDPRVSTGTIAFDGEGHLTTTTPVSVSIDRQQTAGAESPLAFDLKFDSVTALGSGQSAATSTLSKLSSDGSSMGELSGYGIGADGTINGTFSNGLIRVIGQIPLVTFSNIDGLVDAGGNLFAVGVDSARRSSPSPARSEPAASPAVRWNSPTSTSPRNSST
ncbi:MAG: flagellar hook-basal body complex protein [Phycisphaerales bacterium]